MDFLFLAGTVVLLHALAVISPGPDFFMVMKNSLGRSRQDGIATSAGIALGIGVHIIYCLAGFALIISQSIQLFTIFKIIAGLYLIWLGISAWRSKISKTENLKISSSDLKKSFNEGFITNVLNPKASLFFLSLFTLVLPQGLPVEFILGLGGIMILDTFIWFAIVSLVITTQKVKRIYSDFSVPVTKFFGVVLALLGAKLILAEK